MKRVNIKNYLYTDIEFQYKRKNGAFCPVDKYIVGWNGSEDAFDNIDDAINFPCFDGKSIIEIWDEIYPQISYSGDVILTKEIFSQVEIDVLHNENINAAEIYNLPGKELEKLLEKLRDMEVYHSLDADTNEDKRNAAIIYGDLADKIQSIFDEVIDNE